ncbi:MAG: LuxR C-terminal-related transcriptional regulator [Ilumatobacter sp.]
MTRPPIVRAKLRPPMPTSDLVVRDRLIRRLFHTSASVWSVVAPAGFGKTTLLVRALEDAGASLAWVSVDAADDNPVRFWSHVAAALGEVGIGVDRALPPLLDGDVDRVLDEILAAIDAWAVADDREVVLLLDDVHEISNPVVLRGLERVVAHPPAGLRVAMSSRHEVDLGLARRRLHGDVADVVASDLAFTLDEGRIALAAEINGGALDVEDADSLVEGLGGWPAGVRLARLALRNAPDGGAGSAANRSAVAGLGGASPEVAAYLASEVLGGLEPHVRQFLVDTSILMDLGPGLCDSVTGRSDSLSILRALAADHVFTSLVDPVTSTFRVHRIFREFLSAQAAERAESDVADLHRRAMRWYLSVGDLDGIVWHATRAGEFDVALNEVGERLFDASNRGRIDDMWRWIEWIGSERVLADPVLASLPAWVSLNQRRYDEIEPWLEAIAMVDGVSEEHLRLFGAHAATVRSARDRHLGDVGAAVSWAREAVRLTATHHEWAVVATVHATLAQALALVGDREAESFARSAIDLAAGHEPALVMAYGALGYSLENPDEASAAADSALSFVTTDDLERFHRPALAWLARAKSAFASGRVGDARDAVDRAIELASLDEPAVLAIAWALDARIAHLLGRGEDRRRSLRSADAVLDELSGADRIEELVRGARAATRFAPGADDLLPVGARDLSDRELAVLRMLPFELSRRDLAAQLYVSENTVKTHLTSIRRKLGLRGRADIVERARDLGLLEVAERDVDGSG